MMLMGSWFRPYSQQMADRVAELGSVERVEMEMADAAGVKLPGELGGDSGGDQLTRGGKIVEPFEQPIEPFRDLRTAGFREPPRGRHVRHRQDSRNDLDVDARGSGIVAEAQE